ncbi:hypothetical protein P886_3673 [Alteromonadaceae bacterium 2753L.S.0a.02]|nr:hypothetical protein P886_3673 [Alteromonadaceae bacterium 2753L.S.0a.02]
MCFWLAFENTNELRGKPKQIYFGNGTLQPDTKTGIGIPSLSFSLFNKRLYSIAHQSL